MNIGTLRRKLQKAHKMRRVGPRGEHLKTSWATVGRAFGIPGGTAHRIATSDYEPKRPSIRFRLGLPTLVPAPVCSQCGQLHVSKRCVLRKRKSNPFAGWVILIPVETI